MKNNWDDTIMNQVFKDYLNLKTTDEKHKLFNDKIYNPLMNMIDEQFDRYKNRINIFLDSIDDIKFNCITFIYEHIEKFNPYKILRNGTPVSSKMYFRTIIRCFFHDTMKRNYDEKRKRVSLDEYEE